MLEVTDPAMITSLTELQFKGSDKLFELEVTADVTVQVGNNTQSFTNGELVSPTSIYANTLLFSGFAVISGVPSPEPEPEELYFSELSSTVFAVYYGDNAATPRPNSKVVVWIGNPNITPQKAFDTDILVGHL